MSVSQTQFHAAMLDAAQEVPLGLIDGEGQAAGRRFSVYRNNVSVALTDALEAGFPVIAKLLGEANFRPIAGVFLRQHPPKTPMIMLYGAEFPGFLEAFPPLKHLGYLGDVARLELALRQSYHAADATPIAAEALAAIDPAQLPALRFTLSPALRLIRSAWPIYDIWAYNMQPGAPKPRSVAQDVVVLRPEFDPQPHALPPGSATFIEALAAGKTLGQSAEAATVTNESFDLSAPLSLLLQGGAITAIESEDIQ